MRTVKLILLLVVLSVTPSLSTLGQDDALPFKHTACASGVDLTGQTIIFPQVINQSEQIDSLVDPLKAGFADASAYFNAHGGICGATVQGLLAPPEQSSNVLTQYQAFAALNPRPVMVGLYSSGDAEDFRDTLAQDKISGLLIRGGSVAGLYGADGQTPGWIYATFPLYVNQLGAMCSYIAANPNTYPKPMLGIISDDDGWSRAPINDQTIGYCQAKGVGFVGARYAGDAGLKPLVDKGANVIYMMTVEDGAAKIARGAEKLGLQDRFKLAGVNLVMDPAVASFLTDKLPQGQLPPLNGTIGILPMRTWSETDDPGIQFITQQADANGRSAKLRTTAYIRAWSATDLFVEAYIQTVNRVGAKAVNGEEMKATLDKLDYSTLGGVQKFAYDGGARRDVGDYRIGKIAYLGADGKSPASADNPLLLQGDPPAVVPLLLPITDFLPAPDLRPGGADVVAAQAAAEPTAAVVPPVTPGRIGAGQFVFQANDGKGGGDPHSEIYVTNTDGSNLTQLTDNDFFDGQPLWSPDGTKIVFVSDRNGKAGIFVMNADGSDPVNLSNNLATEEIPTWSPDGTKIAFAGGDSWETEDIYVMDADGSNQTNLTNSPGFDDFPSFSPDGKQITFTSNRGGRDEIYIMNADGSDVTKITETTVGDNYFPLWSPDGSKIIFNSDRDGDFDVYEMNVDGSDLVNLTNDDVGAEKPTWLPDGKQIIFTAGLTEHWDMFVMNADGSNIANVSNGGKNGWGSWKPAAPQTAVASTTDQISAGRIIFEGGDGGAKSEVYSMNTDGSDLKDLTNNSNFDGQPVWSPDGSKIVFVSDRDGNADIYVMNADGGSPINVSNNTDFEELPTWSPDGKKIVYDRVVNGKEEIYVMNADGSNQTNLTNNPAFDAFPSWSPDGKHIAFTSDRDGNQDIYVMDADGSHVSRLTETPIGETGWPTYSPDGTKIAFTSDQDGDGDVYVMNADGSNPVNLTENDYGDGARLGWTADGMWILYDSEGNGKGGLYAVKADGSHQAVRLNTDAIGQDVGIGWASWKANPTASNSSAVAAVFSTVGAGKIVFNAGPNGLGDDDPRVEIYVMNADGSNTIQLTHNHDFEGEQLWSPDGTKILFISDHDGTHDVYVMNADGSNTINLTNNSAWQELWSVNGTKIAFTSDRDGNSEVYVMNADGSNQTNLSNNPGFDNFPDFSPDGKKIAFTSDRGGRDEIYIMNADGSNVTKITDTTVGDNLFPLWSPDGSKIIFNSDRDGDMDIYMMSPDGSNIVNLTNDDSGEEKAAWSPDGKQIIFASNRTGNWDMYVMNADGSNVVNLTHSDTITEGWGSWTAK